MKVSLNWIKEIVDLPWASEDVPEKLAALGFPVESIERKGIQASGVVAARILSVEKHPNADRLRIAKVNDGKGERTVVCGAPNIAPGQIVPLAVPGARLPGGIKIEVSSIRGVESHGMLCSERELGISGEHAGIFQLPDGTSLGTGVSEALGGEDTVFEVEVTPNRPDVLSHVGLARELAALGRKSLKVQAAKTSSGKETSVDIQIAEPKLCYRYLGRVLRGVKVGPSPDWMTRRLTACGIRSINNVVDITNYVLLEWGHPLHAFDLSRLKGPAIRVRRAKPGEKFLALDERTYNLTADDLVIADKEAAVALAGIMGGQDSGVTGATTDILLESAVFERSAIRQTSRRLGLKSESSIRFEKGTDAETAEKAWARASALIAELAGGRPDGRGDVFPTKTRPRPIVLRRDRLDSLLGVPIPTAAVTDILKRLDLQPKASGKSGWTCTPPPYRKDLAEDVDVIEDVIRIHGYNFPTDGDLPKFRVGRPVENYRVADASAVVESLRGYGLNETLTSSLCPPDWAARFAAGTENQISLANPISQDESVLRPYLAINLIRAAIRNFNHQRDSVALFEIGKTFLGKEEPKLGLLICGRSAARTWRTAETDVDIFVLKGILEALGRYAAGGYELKTGSAAPFLHPNQSFTVHCGGKPAGWAGLLDPRLASEIDFSAPCAIAEIDLDVFRPARWRAVKAIAKHPFVERDIAVLVDRSTTWEALRNETEKSAGALLVSVQPFDVFSGGSLEAEKKSVAFRVRLQDAGKTLSESEISAVIDRIKSSLQKNCGAQPR